MPGPLAHLSVVDLTDLRGALAGRLLADLGADVVKVEPPGGDPDRLRPPFVGGVPGKDRSLPFLYRNANKRGVMLDLHDAGGWRRFLGLCEGAGILIENLGPDAARRHGLAPTEIHERHPHLVHLAIADFGLTGPRSGWRLEALPAFAAARALHAADLPARQRRRDPPRRRRRVRRSVSPRGPGRGARPRAPHRPGESARGLRRRGADAHAWLLPRDGIHSPRRRALRAGPVQLLPHPGRDFPARARARGR